MSPAGPRGAHSQVSKGRLQAHREGLHPHLNVSMAKFSRLFWRYMLVATLTVAASGLKNAGVEGSQESSTPSKLTYTKTLKGSVPEYLRISVNANGAGTYEGRKLDEPPNPRPIQLSPAVVARLFALTQGLGYFRSIDLESHKKVANMGQKVFTYQQGNETNRAEFNYTLNRQAQELSDLFEKIASVEQHVTTLEFSMKYDPLGLPGELRQIQIDLANDALADPQLLVPSLEKISRNSRYMHLAQSRAQDILQRIQANN